jgi:hypothetical protein
VTMALTFELTLPIWFSVASITSRADSVFFAGERPFQWQS